MGSWNTVHLFDVKKFYNDITPTLRGEKGCLDNDYIEFLSSYRIGGISKLTSMELKKITDISISKTIEISNQFDLSFKHHKLYNNIDSYDEQMSYLNDNQYYYEFNAFFEYYVFKYCSDFNPHIQSGKQGLNSVLDPKHKTIGYEILDNLEDFNTLFSACYIGIGNWIDEEDTNLLFNCKEDLFSKEPYDKDDYIYFEEFIRFIEIASSNKLGLIRGIDLRESTLERLPKHKLIGENYLNTFKGNFNKYFTSTTKKNIKKEKDIQINEYVIKKKEINSISSKKTLIKRQYKRNKNIPNDLKIISFKDFHSIVYQSIIEQKIYISYYYESGFFQGNLNLELNPNEIIKFRESPKKFIDTQANLLSNKFTQFHKERNIENFIEQNHSIELINEWKKNTAHNKELRKNN